MKPLRTKITTVLGIPSNGDVYKRQHNPEFTVMEIYVAYKDYLWMMEFTERMLEKVALAQMCIRDREATG